jgi:hypothetical protein
VRGVLLPNGKRLINGENQVLANGCSQSEAWDRAEEQARSMGMLVPTGLFTAVPKRL